MKDCQSRAISIAACARWSVAFFLFAGSSKLLEVVAFAVQRSSCHPTGQGPNRLHARFLGTDFPRVFALASSQSDDDEVVDPRDNVGRMMRGMISTGISKDTIDSSDVVVAKADLPNLGIYADQTYELRSIYLQGVNPDTEAVERIALESLEDDGGKSRPGYTRYIKLFSPMYHDEPVVVTPEEVGLVSLKEEVFDSVRVALPILTFWTTLCIVFATKYNERYGGNFWDALFGR